MIISDLKEGMEVRNAVSKRVGRAYKIGNCIDGYVKIKEEKISEHGERKMRYKVWHIVYIEPVI
jgi:hypothetical protein